MPPAFEWSGGSLVSWINRQRRTYKAKKLSRRRTALLELLPGWTWLPFDEVWQSAYDVLARFAATHGDIVIGQSEEVEGFRLGRWINKQRQEYKRGHLSRDKVRQLEKLTNWSWDPHGARWDRAYRALQRYVAANSHADVPDAFVNEEGFKLGQWVRVQRRAHQDGSLSSLREIRLQELPGWRWKTKETD